MLAALIWQSPQFSTIATALVAVIVAAVAWAYSPQLRAAPPRWGWLLPGLRIVALIALAVSVLKPVAARPRAAWEKGAVMFLVDESQSMGIADTGRSPAQLVALADGLGLLPSGARPDLTAGLRPQLELVRAAADRVARARSEADYARLSGRGVE